MQGKRLIGPFGCLVVAMLVALIIFVLALYLP